MAKRRLQPRDLGVTFVCVVCRAPVVPSEMALYPHTTFGFTQMFWRCPDCRTQFERTVQSGPELKELHRAATKINRRGR